MFTQSKPTDVTIFNIPHDLLIYLATYLDAKSIFNLALTLTCGLTRHYDFKSTPVETKKDYASRYYHTLFQKGKSCYEKELQNIRIGASRSSGFYFSANGNCYVWGGSPYNRNVQIIKQIDPLLSGKKIKKIVGDICQSGFIWTVFITKDGEVYATAAHHRPGFDKDKIAQQVDDAKFKLFRLLENKKIIDACRSVNNKRTYFLTSDNEIYYYDILTHHLIESTGQHTIVEHGEKIIALAAGANHILFLTASGKVYGQYSNEFGELGIGNNDYQPVPVLIPLTKKIAGIAAGREQSYFLTAEGEVYVCGRNGYGQLGLGHYADQNNPQLVASLHDKKIVKISTGRDFALLLASDGMVYGCGWNSSGQLALGNEEIQAAPQKIEAFERNKIKIRDVAAGFSFSLFLTEKGQLYSCGDNLMEQLGLDSFSDLEYLNVPMKVSFAEACTKEMTFSPSNR